MVRLPSKLARGLRRPYEAVTPTSSSLKDNPHFATSGEGVRADNDNNSLQRSSNADRSYDELVANSESSLFENESNAIEDLIEISKPSCLRRRSCVASSNDDIELALYPVKPSDNPTNDDATEMIPQDGDSSCSSSQENDTEKIYNKFDDTLSR